MTSPPTQSALPSSSRYNRPLVIVNFKAYAEATGKNALKLAKMAENVAKESGIYVVVAPQFVDIAPIVAHTSVPVYSQHIDSVTYGGHTGHVLAEAVKEAGAVGTLINHSERRLLFKDIDACIRRARETGLVTCVCSDTAKNSMILAHFHPDMIAVEPPELIGSGISVSKARPEVVSDTVSMVTQVDKEITILCGAGITQGEDVAAALKLGASGVLVASGIVKAKNPKAALLDLVSPMTD